jgi:hypothetical protein
MYNRPISKKRREEKKGALWTVSVCVEHRRYAGCGVEYRFGGSLSPPTRGGAGRVGQSVRADPTLFLL